MDVTIIYKLLDEAEHDIKNCAFTEEAVITVCKVCINIHIMRKQNSIIGLLFIQNIHNKQKILKMKVYSMQFIT